MFRITLIDPHYRGDDGPDQWVIRWPETLTTVTDGGALLLFEEVSPKPGPVPRPTKRLVLARAPGTWLSVEAQDYDATYSGWVDDV